MVINFHFTTSEAIEETKLQGHKLTDKWRPVKSEQLPTVTTTKRTRKKNEHRVSL